MNTTKKFASLAAILTVAAWPHLTAAQANSGPNGGRVVTAQGHPIELVRNGLNIVFYVGDDDGSPLSTKDVKGRAMVQDGGRNFSVPLRPGAPNRLFGKVPVELSPQAQVVFSATWRGQSLTARYAPQ